MKYKIRLMISSLTVFVPMLILLIVALQVIIWSFTEVSVFSWRSSYFDVYYSTQYTKYIYINAIFDLGSLILVTGLLSINFFEDFVIRHRWVMTFTSTLSAYVVVLGGKFKKLKMPLYNIIVTPATCRVFVLDSMIIGRSLKSTTSFHIHSTIVFSLVFRYSL